MERVAEWSLACVDAGSEYCPCYLAASGECFVCSLLRGEEFCACSWSGTCSYLHYLWSQGQIKTRREIEVTVTREELGPNLLRLVLDLPPAWMGELGNPGAFLFLRHANVPPAAAVPVSVFEITEAGAEVVLYVDGPKTRLLAPATATSRLVAKGPYYNGVQGLAALKRARGGEAVLVAGGVGQSATVLVARQLLRGGNRVRACLAPGRAGVNYAAERLRVLSVEVKEVKSLRGEGLSLVSEWLRKKPTVVFSAGPDTLHREVALLMAKAGAGTELATSQNTVLCCGEGLCGSCVILTAGRRRVPRCKAQFQVERR